MSTPASVFAQLASKIGNEGLNSSNAAPFAAEIAKIFNVREHEVGILRLDKKLLRFIYPANLASAGTIPVGSTMAVAARVVSTGTPESINNLAQTKHASVFEAVGARTKPAFGQRVSEEDKLESVIQKMMTVPVPGPAGVMGVIEVSRKGKTAPAAGVDFTPADLQKLATIAMSLARYFK